MPSASVDFYFDFRSPYAYFAATRVRRSQFKPARDVDWRWHPVSIDVLLNLQAGRAPWADYVDPLPAPKRAHLIADVRRTAAFHDIPLRPPKPSRPNSIPALCAAAQLDRNDRGPFKDAVFTALWQEQRDIGNPEILAHYLPRQSAAETLAYAFSPDARQALAGRTVEAYARGIFGVPTFVWNDEVFFGNDRLDMLAWRLGAVR
jgi:2-hydroxychromene-2-carboxylate isomerase